MVLDGDRRILQSIEKKEKGFVFAKFKSNVPVGPPNKKAGISLLFIILQQ
jgi:hypothetical protein